MSKISRRRLRTTAAAAGTGVIAVAALAATAHAGPLGAAASAVNSSQLSYQFAAPDTGAAHVRLAPMPQGTVTFGRGRHGTVNVAVNAFGLTPGSSHRMELMDGLGQVVTTFSPLTANSAGRAIETLGTGYRGTLESWLAVILNGTAGDPVSAEPIALTGRYDGQHSYRLTAAEFGPDRMSYGTPQGSAVVSYDPGARTISVTVNASGLTPGAHAAHIHAGSCVSQGAVEYMMTDFTANAGGQIVNQTRVVAHVSAPLPASGWYFNLHQGNSGDILAHGSPTISFRPLLCG